MYNIMSEKVNRKVIFSLWKTELVQNGNNHNNTRDAWGINF